MRHLADIEAIRQLSAVYAATVDRRDYDGFADCFVDGAEWSGPTGRRVGRDQIIARTRDAVDHLRCTQHMVSNFQIELDGDRAAMTSYFHATHVGAGRRDGELYVIGGRYEDALVRTDAGWRFARRIIVPLWSSGDPSLLVAE
ncbi:MAG: nuclear transport factor 2 family protein [Alphaproteobacteria bacterium]|nr:nuclear transport factor 2 family protein [Alphaproteobacteria bacterium]